MKARTTNIAMLEIVASGLKDLLGRFVFVGGATTAIYLDDEGAPHVRLTDDVDCITEIASVGDYHRLEARLRALGFKNSVMRGDPICRWIFQGIKVDVMPDDRKILGFTNRWYKKGIAAAATHTLPSGTAIRTLTPAFFMATKIEAFRDRGHADYHASADLEDIVSVLDGRTQIWDEIRSANSELREYLREAFRDFYGSTAFVQSLAGHLPPDPSNTARAKRILDRIQGLVTP